MYLSLHLVAVSVPYFLFYPYLPLAFHKNSATEVTLSMTLIMDGLTKRHLTDIIVA